MKRFGNECVDAQITCIQPACVRTRQLQVHLPTPCEQTWQICMWCQRSPSSENVRRMCECMRREFIISEGQKTQTDPCYMLTQVLLRIFLRERSTSPAAWKAWTGACRTSSLLGQIKAAKKMKPAEISSFFLADTVQHKNITES